MGKFDGKVAVVTGGGQGLGRAMCRRIAREGATVAVCDINLETANETVKILAEEEGNPNAFAVYGDVTNEESVKEMVKTVVDRCGTINLLVNNCGISLETRKGLRICDTDFDMFKTGIAINLYSVFLCTKHIVPVMIEAGGGAICNVSSLAAYFPAFGASYGAAKAAVIALTKTIALQYVDDNIRCNCICPGAMDTPSGMNANKIGPVYSGDAPKVEPPRVRMINRIADPMEMANVAVFLLSDEASYVTGTYVKVDGGSMAMSVKIPPRVKKDS